MKVMTHTDAPRTAIENFEFTLSDCSPNQLKLAMQKAESLKTAALKEQERNEKLVSVLLENGFIEGEHFENTFELVTESNRVTIWDNEVGEMFAVLDLEAVYPRGDVRVLYKQYSSYMKEISVQKAGIDYAYDYRLGDTLRCYGITKQFRYYKAGNMLGHLEAKNASSEQSHQADHMDELSITNLILEMKTQFPLAEVTRTRMWQSKRSIDAVKVQFKSNSYVLLNKLGDILELYDAVGRMETREQKLARLYSQKG